MPECIIVYCMLLTEYNRRFGYCEKTNHNKFFCCACPRSQKQHSNACMYVCMYVYVCMLCSFGTRISFISDCCMCMSVGRKGWPFRDSQTSRGTYNNTFIHTYIHSYIHTYIYIHTCRPMVLKLVPSIQQVLLHFIGLYSPVCSLQKTQLTLNFTKIKFLLVCKYVYMYVLMYICMYVYMYVCMYRLSQSS